MLAECMSKHNVDCWLVTRQHWVGRWQVRNRFPMPARIRILRIIDGIHTGEPASAKAECENFWDVQPLYPYQLGGCPIGVAQPEEGLDRQGRF